MEELHKTNSELRVRLAVHELTAKERSGLRLRESSKKVGKKVPSKVSSKPSPAVSKVEKPENMANSRIEQLEKDIVALSEELRATNHELGQMQLENQRLRLVERCSECKLTRRVSFSEDVMGPDEDCYSTGEHGYTSDITTIHELKEVVSGLKRLLYAGRQQRHRNSAPAFTSLRTVDAALSPNSAKEEKPTICVTFAERIAEVNQAVEDCD
uniref:Uncharacterized protein n=1 Tax=Eutreptiella gymnastica TaxID=73025 RepID=A0A7S4FJ49_9EUGL